MPELVSCLKCGKDVLTSRYAWSQAEVICRSCAEGSHSSEEPLPQLVKGIQSEDSKKVGDEIILTWLLLTKIVLACLGGITLISMLVVGVGNLYRKVPPESISVPSNKIIDK